MGLFGNDFFGGGIFGGGIFGGGMSDGGITGGTFPKQNKAVREFIKQTDTPVGELLRTVDDTKEEFYELCTDGFKEMVVEGNENYKTSHEIREEADEIIARAKSRYEGRCYEFNQYLEKLNAEVGSLYAQKVELANRINQEVKAMPSMPKFEKHMDLPEYSYKQSFMSILGEITGFETGVDVKGKKDSANEYWENANDYEVRIAGKIAEINKEQAFLDTIKVILEEEKQLLGALNDSIDTKRGSECAAIQRQLHILIAEHVLDKNGSKNARYLEAIERLKRIS